MMEFSSDPSPQSFLEQRSVGKGTAVQYRGYIVIFLAFAAASLTQLRQIPPGADLSNTGLDALPGDLVDALATDYLDKLYFEGGLAGDAEKLRAAIFHFCPAWRLMGSHGSAGP